MAPSTWFYGALHGRCARLRDLRKLCEQWYGRSPKIVVSHAASMSGSGQAHWGSVAPGKGMTSRKGTILPAEAAEVTRWLEQGEINHW